MLENVGIFATASGSLRDTRIPPIASPRDNCRAYMAGARARSDINQRANILRGPDNVQPARRRSFYRRRKTIRIYIRAREKGITYARVSAVCVREEVSRPFSFSLIRTRFFRSPRRSSTFRRCIAALEMAYGIAYWSEGRASAAITVLLPAGFCGCTSTRLGLARPFSLPGCSSSNALLVLLQCCVRTAKVCHKCIRFSFNEKQ